MNKFKRISRIVTSVAVLCALALAACQPQTQPAAVTATGVTQAEAQAICSTLAVARNTPDFNSLDAVLAPSVVTTDPFSSAPMTSLDQLKQFYLGTQSSFPDFSMRYDDIWVSGDRVIAHWTATGTNQGVFFDLQATGKNVTISGLTVMKVESGKVTEQQSYFDLLSIARQLGARLTVAEGEA